ncbi:MAG TPA: thioredoxin domain-containing protein [Thermoanaerobaculia bacterium]|nr:thioredoxin domain-containing protein [Thermoanaerobaculia bacterium]
MKRTLILFAALAATAAFAQQDKPAESKLDEKTEALVRQSIPVCKEMTITRAELQQSLPLGLKGALVRVASPRPACEGQYLIATSPVSGDFYIGLPWVLGEVEGKTIEEKLKNFAWTGLQENFTPVVTRERTRNGLLPVSMLEMTEQGKVALEGEIDPEAKVFFLGHFVPATGDLGAARIKTFEPRLANAPTRGAAKPDVTVVEFSDFECPSCKHASTYLDPIMEKYGDRVRYIRYDLPLITSHPWAFAAAMAGRAIYRQKPEAFWDYKKQIYSNQDKLTTFTFDDFARGFAQDHDLDMKRYDADISSAEVRDELLKSVGAAFSNGVRATPTYMVNGKFVDAGDEGKALEPYVAGLLKK